MSKPNETSIWKKEITLRRKPKREAAAPRAVEAAKPAETSIWKKEITFRRKPSPKPKAVPLGDDTLVRPARAPVPAAPHSPEPPAADPAPALGAPSAPPVFVPGDRPVPLEPEPQHDPEAEPELQPPAAAPEPARVQLEEAPPAPAEPAGTPSRRERKDEKRSADRLAKLNRQRAKELEKEERKASRHKQARVVGLKVGASQIAAAYVVNKGAPRLIRMARAPLPHGVVVGGELREPEQLAAALKTLFRKNKLPQTCVRLGIANNRIGVRTFEITGVEDDAQLANAVRFRAQEALPIPLDEAVLDYRILDDRVGDDGVRVCRVLLVVAHRELVERYVAACRKAGLKLIGIDLEAFGLLRALSDPSNPPSSDAAVVCVAIGHDRSTLAVSNGRVCEFTRVLSWGGSDLDVALARTLDLTPAAAEPLKRELMLGETGE